MTDKRKNANWFESGMIEFANARYDKCIELFTRAIEWGDPSALIFVSRGAAYLKLDMLEQAEDDFDSAIAVDPEYARAYHMRGLVKERGGNDQAALEDFDKAIDLKPEYGAAYYSRATLHAKRSDTEHAQSDIEMVAHLGSRNMETYMSENNVWHTQHMRVEDAIETELER